MLSSDNDEFEKHNQYIQKEFGLQLSISHSDYGLTTYDLSDMEKLAKTLTYRGKSLTDSDVALIKQLAQTLADKN